MSHNDPAIASNHQPVSPAINPADLTAPKFMATNWALIGGGLACLVLGFLLLVQVNADASNWQGTAAPVLLLSGYGLVFVGILHVPRDRRNDDDHQA